MTSPDVLQTRYEQAVNTLLGARTELARLEEKRATDWKSTESLLRRTADARRSVTYLENKVERYRRQIAELENRVTYDRESLADAKMIRTDLGWHTVLRVNAKSVTVPHTLLPNDVMRVSFNKVTGVHRES